ncbi:unnamed protein product [Linum tenue]|nr:unnamed protein product [Linum tenue]
MVEDHYVLTRRWKRGFDPEEGDDVLTNLLVWVRLPKLPMDYYDSEILKDIGNSIGRYIKMDAATRDASRGHYARICVEVDLSKPLIVKYRLERRIRRLQYEGLHNVCFECGRFGHAAEACPKNASPSPTDEDFRQAQNPATQRKIEEERPEIFEDFGPWMLASRNRKRNPRTSAATNGTPRNANNVLSAPTHSGSRFAVLNDLNDELMEHPSSLALAAKKGVDGSAEDSDTVMAEEIGEASITGVVSQAINQTNPLLAPHPSIAPEKSNKGKPNGEGTVAGIDGEVTGKAGIEKSVGATTKGGKQTGTDKTHNKNKGGDKTEAKKQAKQHAKGPRQPLPSTPPFSSRASQSTGRKGAARSLDLNDTPEAVGNTHQIPPATLSSAVEDVRFMVSEAESKKGVQATSNLDVHACNKR